MASSNRVIAQSWCKYWGFFLLFLKLNAYSWKPQYSNRSDRWTRGFGGAKTCHFALYKLKRSLQMPLSPVTSLIRRVLHTVHLPLTSLVYFISVHSPFYSLLCTDGIITNQELGFSRSFRSFSRWSIQPRLPCVALLLLFLIFAFFTHVVGLSRFGPQICQDGHN